jgi:hypothetical protein
VTIDTWPAGVERCYYHHGQAAVFDLERGRACLLQVLREYACESEKELMPGPQIILLAVAVLTAFVSCPRMAVAQTEEFEGATEAEINHLSNMDLEQLVNSLDETWSAYNKQLQAVVKTRLLEEKEFVAAVVLLIQKGKVPKNLVDSSWLWVRSNRPVSNSPFVYFERVLRLRADKANIPIPPFDARIYSLSRSQRTLLQQQRRRR